MRTTGLGLGLVAATLTMAADTAAAGDYHRKYRVWPGDGYRVSTYAPAPVVGYVARPVVHYRPVVHHQPVLSYQPVVRYVPVVDYRPVVSYRPVLGYRQEVSYYTQPIVAGYGYGSYGYARRHYHFTDW